MYENKVFIIYHSLHFDMNSLADSHPSQILCKKLEEIWVPLTLMEPKQLKLTLNTHQADFNFNEFIPSSVTDLTIITYFFRSLLDVSTQPSHNLLVESLTF